MKPIYYYEHQESACYYCVVNASDSSFSYLQRIYAEKQQEGDIDYVNSYDDRVSAYCHALAREKNDLVKLSDYINGSAQQYVVE